MLDPVTAFTALWRSLVHLRDTRVHLLEIGGGSVSVYRLVCVHALCRDYPAARADALSR